MKKNAWNWWLACALLLSVGAGCNDATDADAAEAAEADEAESFDQETAERAARPSAQATTCAMKYASCLMKSWQGVLTPAGLQPITMCTKAAEDCGLFVNAPDAGPRIAPSCGMEIADCLLKNLADPGKCSLQCE